MTGAAKAVRQRAPAHDAVAGPLLAVDGLTIEDSSADVDLNLVMKDGGGIIEVQGTAEGEPFSQDHLLALLALARQGITQLIEAQHAALTS